MKLKAALFLLPLLLLWGCGSRTQTDGDSGTAAPEEIVDLKFAHCWAQQDAVDRIIEEYNRSHADIQVDVEYIPVEQYVTTLKNRSAAGELPDIYMGWPGSSMEWFYRNQLAMDLSGEDWVSRLEEDARKDVTYEGTIRMLPMNKTFICIGYNKTLFDRLGCEPPDNYEDFVQICEKIRQTGILPIALGSRDSSGYIYPSWMMAVSEIYAYDRDYDQKLYDGTETMGEKWNIVLSRQLDWLQKGYVAADHLTLDRMSDSLDLFAEGKAGMFILGSWEIDDVQKRIETKSRSTESEAFPMGYFPMPSSQDSGILLYASGEGLCVNQQSSKKEQALEVLQYFTEEEPNRLFQNAMNSFSTFPDLNLEYTISKEINEYVTEKDTWGYPDAFWPRIIGDEYAKLFPQYLAGKITSAQFMERMDELWHKKDGE